MRWLVGSDEAKPVVEHIAWLLREKRHSVTLAPVATWGLVATSVATQVAAHAYDRGIVCCWTGTGVSIAANKIVGIRAALCTDAETARGARKWNDANILALSLRLTREPLATEIVDAFATTEYDGTEEESLSLLMPRTSYRDILPKR